MVSPPVLGVHRRQQRPQAQRLARPQPVEAGHPPGHLRLGPFGRPGPPLPRRQQQQQHAQEELEPAGPGGGLAVVRGVGRAGQQQDDRAQDGQAGQPADREQRAVGAAAGRGQQQDDGHDRQGADRDAGGQPEDVTDGRAHGPSSSAGSGPGSPNDATELGVGHRVAGHPEAVNGDPVDRPLLRIEVLGAHQERSPRAPRPCPFCAHPPPGRTLPASGRAVVTLGG
jgi:hypothetical protein